MCWLLLNIYVGYTFPSSLLLFDKWLHISCACQQQVYLQWRLSFFRLVCVFFYYICYTFYVCMNDSSQGQLHIYGKRWSPPPHVFGLWNLEEWFDLTATQKYDVLNNEWIYQHVSYCIRKEMDMWPYFCHNSISMCEAGLFYLLSFFFMTAKESHDILHAYLADLLHMIELV